MTANPYEPTDLDHEWDVVVIGTGMGGATIGHALAKKGHSVLFIEKGHYMLSEETRGSRDIPLGGDDAPNSRLRRGEWPMQLQGRTTFGDVSFFAPLGCGTGGTTNLYACQLERFHPSDFEPRKWHADVNDSTVPERWPISYDELLPYYRAAEKLYHVTGTEDPLRPDEESVLVPPPPLSPRDQDLFESFTELGLHPYRAHTGFRFFDGCGECGATACPVGCKSDASTIALLPALERHNARLLVDCEVLELEASEDRVEAVRCRYEGREIRVRGKRVILAAGALMSPLLLLNSKSDHWPEGVANRSGAVGRNLMFHVGDFVIVKPRRALSTEGPRKSLAISDMYVHEGKKLGLFNSVGIEITYWNTLYVLKHRADEDPRWWRSLFRPFFPLAALIGATYYRGAVAYASIVEDLPYWHNRIVPDPDFNDGRRFEYDYSDELQSRNQLMRKLLRQRLGKGLRIRIPSGANNLNYGHVCGTCRFGDEPETSVLNRDNRAHDVENLYVVDAGFFPSSSGTNVSLTIAANALRVADAIGDPPV